MTDKSLSGAKCQPGHLRRPEQSEFTGFDYETIHPWESILSTNYFLPISRWFLDTRKRWLPVEIRIFRMVSEGGRHWWEKATLVVTNAEDSKRVDVAIKEKPHTVGAPEGIGLQKVPEPAPVKKAA